ncbi:hypothetical protein J7L49_04920 [Candidatus Bathyarchaeota archaeon]|nr:hypothetical protein [Candidatus Bathyarchaeota archaeon]
MFKKYEYFEKCDPKGDGTFYCEIGYRDPASGKVVAKKSGILVPQPGMPAKTKTSQEAGLEDLLEKLRKRWEKIRTEGFEISAEEKGSAAP